MFTMNTSINFHELSPLHKYLVASFIESVGWFQWRHSLTDQQLDSFAKRIYELIQEFVQEDSIRRIDDLYNSEDLWQDVLKTKYRIETKINWKGEIE